MLPGKSHRRGGRGPNPARRSPPSSARAEHATSAISTGIRKVRGCARGLFLIAEVDGRCRARLQRHQLADVVHRDSPSVHVRLASRVPKGENDVRSRPAAAKPWVRWRVLDDPVNLVSRGRASGYLEHAEQGRAHSSREGVLVSATRLSLTRRRQRRSPAAAGADRIERSDRAGRSWRRMPEAKLHARRAVDKAAVGRHGAEGLSIEALPDLRGARFRRGWGLRLRETPERLWQS